MITKPVTFVLIVFSALIIISDARFRGGGSSRTHSSYGGGSRSHSSSSGGWFSSKPAPSSSHTYTPSHSSPSHTASQSNHYSPSNSHSNIGTNSYPKQTYSSSGTHNAFGSGSGTHNTFGSNSGSHSTPFGSGHTPNTNTHLSPTSHAISNSGYGIPKAPNTGNTAHNIGWNPNLNTANKPPTHYTPPTQHQSHVTNTNSGFKPPYPTQNHASNVHTPSAPHPHAPSAPHPHAPSAPHLPSAPHAPSAPAASNIGWKVTPNTGSSHGSTIGQTAHQNTHSGYGTSSHPNSGWSQPSQTVTANKNWQTASSPHGSTSNANYPRQQYHPTQQNSFGSTYHPQPNQPHVVNNFITNNHQTHINPGVSSYYHTPSVGYHFATYHSYPMYYTPFPGYSPVSSFGLGLALGSSLGHHDHYHDYYDRPSSYHYHHHHYSNSNSNNNNNNNGGSGGNPNNLNNNNNNGNGYNNAANGNNPNSNINNSGPNRNFNSINANNLNNNPNQNMQANQNGTFQEPTFGQSMAPLVYSIPGQTKNDDADSTEIVFTNPYLIVGVENMLLYGEFQDEQDILIVMEQESDGLEPYPWDRWYPIIESNATSLNMETTAIPIAEQTTIANHLQDIKIEINTTTIKIDMEPTSTIQSTNTDGTINVPLAPLPSNR